MAKTGLPMFFNNSPSDRCDQIFWLIKNSDLNYWSQETPFGLNIQLKKKFVKRWGTAYASPNYSQSNLEENISNIYQNDNKSALEDKNKQLKQDLRMLQADKEKSQDIIILLETKLANAESEVMNVYKEPDTTKKALETEVENFQVLKSVIKNSNSDIVKKSNEINCATKTIKSKEKEIYNLEKKSNNQQDTIQRLKADLARIKTEKQTVEKAFKKQYCYSVRTFL